MADLLTDAIAAMRVGAAHSRRVQHNGPFGWRFARIGGAGFHVVLLGSCWFLPPRGEPVWLNAGDLVFLPRGGAHAIADSPTTKIQEAIEPLEVGSIDIPRRYGAAPTSSDDFTTKMLCGAFLLDHARYHPMFLEMPEAVCIHSEVGKHWELRSTIELLAAELDHDGAGGPAAIAALVELLLTYILRTWIIDRQLELGRVGWAAALSDPRISLALQGIHQEPDRAWTLESLAASCGMSRSAFARQFVELVGQPPMTYLTWWRMTLAAKALRETSANLADIANSLAYASEFAFGHAFKRQYGMSPGRYRRERIAV